MSTTEWDFWEFPPPADLEMNAKMAIRRGFLKGGAALTGIVVAGLRRAEAEEPSAGASRTAHADGLAYEKSSAFEPSTRVGSTGLFTIDGTWTGDFGLSTRLQDSVGITTPSSLHFVNSHGYLPIPTARYQSARASAAQSRPRGSPLDVGCRGSQTLALCGARSFSECNANSSPAVLAAKTRNKKAATVHKTHGDTGCSESTGVPLSLLLDQVGVCKRARLASWPKATKQADKPKASLRLDGKARLFQAEMGPQSVTTRPSGGQHLSTPRSVRNHRLGRIWPWAIRRVEVSTDGGKEWKDAHLEEPYPKPTPGAYDVVVDSHQMDEFVPWRRSR
jgi:hypothetical protein